MEHKGNWFLALKKPTLSIATLSYQLVQSPNIRRDDILDRTWIRSHFEGALQAVKLFWGSFSQPLPSCRGIVKDIVLPKKLPFAALIGNTSIIPLPIGPTQELHFNSTKWESPLFASPLPPPSSQFSCRTWPHPGSHVIGCRLLSIPC